MTTPQAELTFSETELAMLGKTSDALTAYMGAAVLAEVGETDGVQWVIFARALDQNEPASEDMIHVQMGGPGTRVLGQCGGLETDKVVYDCEFMWAIEITPETHDRFVRLDPEGEVFDSAPELAMLLPFTLDEPELPDDSDEVTETDGMDADAQTDELDRLTGLDGLADLDPGKSTKH